MRQAYTGDHTLLMKINYVDPTKDRDDTSAKAEDWGGYVVIDGDYRILGINDENFIRHVKVTREIAEGDYTSQLYFIEYVLARECDIVGTYGEHLNCKDEAIDTTLMFSGVAGVTKENVYQKNIEDAHYTPCMWFLIDSGKEYWVPLYYVLLNKSMFGSRRGFSFYSVVGQYEEGTDYTFDASVDALRYWNSRAGERVLGCDNCSIGPPADKNNPGGANLCSFGSNLRWWHWLLRTSTGPHFPEEKCGYFWFANRTYGKCNCTTGWTIDGGDYCSEADCVACASRGYGCKFTDGDSCKGCHYSLGPTGEPDIKFVNSSIRSIQSNITARFINETWWRNDSWFRCGDNRDDDPMVCGIPCAFYDCKVPWNRSDPNTVGWDDKIRGGGVNYTDYRDNWLYFYDDYLTNVPPNFCHDWNGDFPPTFGDRGDFDKPAPFYGDRYSKCSGWGVLYICNCTRIEHEPKLHTPCPCDKEDPNPPLLAPHITDYCKGMPCYDYRGRFYRIPTIDTVWANIFDVTPRYENVTSLPCTARITCGESMYSESTVSEEPYWGVVVPRQSAGVIYNDGYIYHRACHTHSTNKICGGCYMNTPEKIYNDVDKAKNHCLSCSGADGKGGEVEECGDYNVKSACHENPCGADLETGGCWWLRSPGQPNGGFCKTCFKGGPRSCPLYNSFEDCENDPCGIGGPCGWNMNLGQQGVGNCDFSRHWTCEQLCPSAKCSKEKCMSASKIADTQCTWTEDYYGDYGCRGCPKVHSCNYYRWEPLSEWEKEDRDECEADTCDKNCIWVSYWLDIPNALDKQKFRCYGCDYVRQQGCGEYSPSDMGSSKYLEDEDRQVFIQSCIENPCNVPGGCAWANLGHPREKLDDGCVSCEKIRKCRDYSWYYNTRFPIGLHEDVYDEGTPCLKDPCNVGPCGLSDMVPVNVKGIIKPGYGCVDIAPAPCSQTCPEFVHKKYTLGLVGNCNAFECLNHAGRTVENGCWLRGADECVNCNGADDYPIASCDDYKKQSGDVVYARSMCVTDPCNVGPCFWNPKAEYCKIAFHVPDSNGTGWLRTRSMGPTEDYGINTKAGPTWPHAGGGAVIPNESEAMGLTLKQMTHSQFRNKENPYRNGSIWSEIYNYTTIVSQLPVLPQPDMKARRELNACDNRTLYCNDWSPVGTTEASTVTERMPEPNQNVDQPPPPWACGTLCGKYVIEWPKRTHWRKSGGQWVQWKRPPYYWYYFNSSMNMTMNETPLGSTVSEMTHWEFQKRSAKFQRDALRGNILIEPAGPYVMDNWFNFGDDGGFAIRDDSANVSFFANYTAYTRIIRETMSMQCKWDGCITYRGKDIWDKMDCYVTIEVGPWRIIENTCFEPIPYSELAYRNQDGKKCEHPWYDLWHYCRDGTWTEVVLNNVPLIVKYIWTCTDRVDRGRCMYCWELEDCDYPIVNNTDAPEGGTNWNKYTFQKELILDNSSVKTDVFGKNLSLERPYYSSEPATIIQVTGYVDIRRPAYVNGSITIHADPALLTSVVLIVPGLYEFEYNLKDHPAGHTLVRLEDDPFGGTTTDVCPKPDGTSEVSCPHSSNLGDIETLECKDYAPYKEILDEHGGRDLAPQSIICYDTPSKEDMDRAEHPFGDDLEDPGSLLYDSAHFEIVHRPPIPLEYYYYLDQYRAIDKNYSWDRIKFGQPVGAWWWGWWRSNYKYFDWDRNFQELGSSYVDTAGFHMQPRLYRGKLETKEYKRAVEGLEVHENPLNALTDMEVRVDVAKDQKDVTFRFWSKSIYPEEFKETTLRVYTLYRSGTVYLLGEGFFSSGETSINAIKRKVILRKGSEVSIEIDPNPVEASNPVTVTPRVTTYPPPITAPPEVIPPPAPKRQSNLNASASEKTAAGGGALAPYRVYLDFLPPYQKYSQWVISGNSVTVMTERKPVHVVAHFDGVLNTLSGVTSLNALDPAPVGGAQPATNVNVGGVYYTRTLSFLTEKVLIILLGYFVIQSFRWFRAKRLDFEVMLKETGVYDVLKDFLGMK